MNRPIFIQSALLVLALLFGSVLPQVFGQSATAPGTTQRSPATKWEYKTIEVEKFRYDVEFNALGEEGWEMCGFAFSTGNGKINACFKRPK